MEKSLKKAQDKKLQMQLQPIPKSWHKVAGILKKKRSALEKHINQTRQDW